MDRTVQDIIAAVATAWGESAIAIVRLSGDGCCELVDGCFKGARPLGREPSRRMVLGAIVDQGNRVDQVLAVRFEHGASYTGEESVEIHCHGGVSAARKCLELFASCGARMALPGEFTKRAFLSGRLDLPQAEAVLGVIKAKSDEALASSERSLHGELSENLRKAADALTGLRAELEVRLDYPEEIDEGEMPGLTNAIDAVAKEFKRLIECCRVGSMLGNGLKVAIIGRPNVGKSSLLNALTCSDRAIVTELPGTTRDTVEVSLVHRGMPICFVDTAGIRDAKDEMIESMGIERARAAAESADICLFAVDAAAGISPEDIAAGRAGRGVKKILVLNKCDLPVHISCANIKQLEKTDDPEKPNPVLRVSALTGEGIVELKDAIFEIAVGNVPLDEGFAATERIVEALRNALSFAKEAKAALTSGAGIDVTGSLLAEASHTVASVLGTDATEELLDSIFSNFCVGK